MGRGGEEGTMLIGSKTQSGKVHVSENEGGITLE